MWIFIFYLIVQIALWFGLNGDFSILAKSSSLFVLLSTIRSWAEIDDLNHLIKRGFDRMMDALDEYLFANLYHEFRGNLSRRLGDSSLRHFQTVVLVILTLVFQLV